MKCGAAEQSTNGSASISKMEAIWNDAMRQFAAAIDLESSSPSSAVRARIGSSRPPLRFE
jgi:hypothetical protein